MKEIVYCLNGECGYHLADEKELDEQTDACGNIICPNCGGMMGMT